MERIYLKSTWKEILHKNSDKEGHLDLFAYEYESDNSKRKLGSLYLIGNVQSAPGQEGSIETDVAYITNLVASLAKREYYSNPDVSPKDAFSSSLKKINDVVEEFFTNKNVKINIGIFAIAGEQINISKLGKFKIILSRAGKNIDILNNIDLFTKERVEEKEFSHVISGKVMPGDKVFAFYPGRLVTARERYFKEYLLKYSADQFLEKINSIKQDKPEFACAALYIDLSKAKESAVIKKTKEVSPSEAPEPELPAVSSDPIEVPRVIGVAHKEIRSESESSSAESSKTDIPRIIRSEFSLGKKLNPFQMVFGKIRPFLPRPKNKKILFGTLLIVVIVSVLFVKSVFITSPEERQIAATEEQVRESLRLIKTKLTQNDVLGARQLLLSSLNLLNSTEIPSEKIDKARIEIVEALDGIDQAIDVSPTLVDDMPEGLRQRISLMNAQKEALASGQYNISSPIAIDIYENNLYILTTEDIFRISNITGDEGQETVSWLQSGALPPSPSLIAVDGDIYVLNNSGVLSVYFRGEKTKEFNTLLLADDSSIFQTVRDSNNLYLINKNFGRIYILNKETGSLIRTLKVGSSQPITEAYLDQEDESIFFTTSDDRLWQVR